MQSIGLNASLAQLVEHALRKRMVVGSIPTGGFSDDFRFKNGTKRQLRRIMRICFITLPVNDVSHCSVPQLGQTFIKQLSCHDSNSSAASASSLFDCVLTRPLFIGYHCSSDPVQVQSLSAFWLSKTILTTVYCIVCKI